MNADPSYIVTSKVSLRSLNLENVNSTFNMISIETSTVDLEQNIFSNIFSESKHIVDSFRSNLTFKNSSFSIFYPIFLYVTSTNLNIHFCNFSNSLQSQGDYFSTSSIFAEYGVLFNLTDCRFENLNSSSSGSVKNILLFILTSEKALNLYEIYDATTENSFNNIYGCSFINNFGDIGAVIYMFNPGKIIINECNFEKNYGQKGSVLFYQNTCKKMFTL